MYSIRWNGGEDIVVGQLDSIIALANIFESRKLKFKVADCAGIMVAPKQFGYNSFNFWALPLENL